MNYSRDIDVNSVIRKSKIMVIPAERRKKKIVGNDDDRKERRIKLKKIKKKEISTPILK